MEKGEVEIRKQNISCLALTLGSVSKPSKHESIESIEPVVQLQISNISTNFLQVICRVVVKFKVESVNFKL